MAKIQLFSPQFRVEECLEEIRECLEKGWTGIGFKTVAIEEEWKKYTGLKNAHFVNSATSGLHLAVKILKDEFNWNENSEIISSPLTFVSTNHAVKYENLNVVFADIDKYLCLDPADVKKKITENTKAVIFVGIGGNSGQLEKLAALCAEHDLKLIIDAAHMGGTRLKGETPGINFADAIVYSFQAVKNLPTADSGMLCFQEDRFDAKARQLSWLGINKDTYSRTNSKGAYKWKYDVEDVGFKYHGNSIMAALALVQLKYLDQDNAYRRQLAKWYNELLAGNKNIETIPVPEDCESSCHAYMIRVKNRDQLLLALNECDIFPGVHYRDNTEYDIYSYARGTCPNVQQASNQLISLPLHLRLSRKDIEYIAEQVINYAG